MQWVPLSDYHERDLKPELRIVSLISSGTEILCGLGLESSIVGISHECDYPESISRLPRLSEPKINVSAPSGKIHTDVQELIQKGLSIYNIKTDLLEKLKPDLIVTQDQCEVCAVSLRDVEGALCQITKKETAVCSLKPHSLDDIVSDFRKVGKFTGRQEQAETLVTDFWIRLNGVNARAGTSGKHKPKVLSLEWLDPLIVGGGWIPELVTLAGGENLFVKEKERFKQIGWSEALASNPDVIVVMPCGYGMEKTLEELKSPQIARQLGAFNATKQGRCFVADGNQYFNRPGPRISDTCEILASFILPDKFKDFTQLYNKTAFTQWSYN